MLRGAFGSLMCVPGSVLSEIACYHQRSVKINSLRAFAVLN